MRLICKLCAAAWLAANLGCTSNGNHHATDSGSSGAGGSTNGAGRGGVGHAGNSGASGSNVPGPDASTRRDGGTRNPMSGMDAGTPDSGGPMPVRGGSSAAAVCRAGASYGDPLAGVGMPIKINPPQGSSFSFIEGPVWFATLATLFFSDNAASPAERIWKLVPPSTTPTVFKENAGANGLAIDNENRLIVCNQGARSVTRVDAVTGDETTLATSYNGKKFNSPNDAVVHSNGTIYFTDPPHGLKQRSAELGFNGIFALSSTGAVTLIESWISRNPNGIVLSADERTLYVSEDNAGKVWKLAVSADGSVIGTSSLFVSTSPTPDGMAVDCASNLYVATSKGIEVFSPTGGKLGTVPQSGSNCSFGGDDRQTLYITASNTLYAVHLNVPGLPD